MSIRFERISKSYGDKVVLQDFSLTLPPSGTVAFMSPSGQGKTTLLRLLAGLEKPDSGRVTGEFKQLSVVFQEDRLLSGVSALGNVTAVLGQDKEARAMEWLDHMGLSEDAHLLPGEMSGGMRRRLAIARAMAYGGDLILLDEPFAGLDDQARERIYPHLFASNPDRLTILVTHNRQEAQRVADRVILMEGTPLTVIEDIAIKK